jgi:nucleoside-diphosphate-sugar epimerase
MFIQSRRAADELGVVPSSVDSALERAVRWYQDNGYLA